VPHWGNYSAGDNVPWRINIISSHQNVLHTMSEQIRKAKVDDSIGKGLTPAERKDLHESMKRNEKALERLSNL